MVVHIIEDDTAVADALAMALEGLDHPSRIYTDGETFLAADPVSAADCVIVDLGLPGISGVEIAELLNKMDAPPRIIAISGKPQMRLNYHLRRVPNLTVLRKPLSINTLLDAMENAACGEKTHM